MKLVTLASWNNMVGPKQTWRLAVSVNKVVMCGVEDLSVETEMIRTHEKGGGRGVEQGRGGEGWRPTVGGKAKEKVEGVCDRGYEFVGKKRIYDTRLPVVESSRRPSNPTLNSKMQTLNKINDDDDNS
ncbi:hypothetical protein E2C01_017289 [Portunus trituberculatus]|uniref:Uncharacterized protein n=1 Tax=Portunus trituberculatus TaxID=210409 RepID=A0A5B7DR96_PORTR|nr:hypothetical protein [Portunus trituberculatus]